MMPESMFAKVNSISVNKSLSSAFFAFYLKHINFGGGS
jgi:hypothetical protein